MLSLFVNWTVSPWAIVTDFGTKPSLEIVTATVFAAADPTAATSATTTRSRITLRIDVLLSSEAMPTW